IEELLSTPLLDGKTRAALIEKLDKLSSQPEPASTVNTAKPKVTVAESKAGWQRGAEQADLELALAKIVVDQAKLSVPRQSGADSKLRCREAATALEAFYRSLPAQIEQLASAESAATGEADQLLRLVDARDAGAIAGNHNMPSRVVWLPTPKGDLTLDRFDSSLELDGKSWVTFPVTLRA